MKTYWTKLTVDIDDRKQMAGIFEI
jgi:hypothetical protein